MLKKGKKRPTFVPREKHVLRKGNDEEEMKDVFNRIRTGKIAADIRVDEADNELFVARGDDPLIQTAIDIFALETGEKNTEELAEKFYALRDYEMATYILKALNTQKNPPFGRREFIEKLLGLDEELFSDFVFSYLDPQQKKGYREFYDQWSKSEYVVRTMEAMRNTGAVNVAIQGRQQLFDLLQKTLIDDAQRYAQSHDVKLPEDVTGYYNVISKIASAEFKEGARLQKKIEKYEKQLRSSDVPDEDILFKLSELQQEKAGLEQKLKSEEIRLHKRIARKLIEIGKLLEIQNADTIPIADLLNGISDIYFVHQYLKDPQKKDGTKLIDDLTSEELRTLAIEYNIPSANKYSDLELKILISHFGNRKNQENREIREAGGAVKNIQEYKKNLEKNKTQQFISDVYTDEADNHIQELKKLPESEQKKILREQILRFTGVKPDKTTSVSDLRQQYRDIRNPEKYVQELERLPENDQKRILREKISRLTGVHHNVNTPVLELRQHYNKIINSGKHIDVLERDVIIDKIMKYSDAPRKTFESMSMQELMDILKTHEDSKQKYGADKDVNECVAAMRKSGWVGNVETMWISPIGIRDRESFNRWSEMFAHIPVEYVQVAEGVYFYKPNKRFFTLLCTNTAQKQQREHVFLMTISGVQYDFYVAYQMKGGKYVYQDEKIFAAQQNWNKKRHITREEKIEDLLNAIVTDKSILAAKSEFRKTLLEIAPTQVDYGANDMDTPYIMEAFRGLVELRELGTNRDLFNVVARFIVFAKLEDAKNFRERLAANEYNPRRIFYLSEHDMLPEYLSEDISNFGMTQELSNFLGLAIWREVQTMAETLLVMLDPTAKEFTGVVDPRFSRSEKVLKLPIENTNEIVYYDPDDRKEYRFSSSDFLERMRTVNFVNPYTGRVFSDSFLKRYTIQFVDPNGSLVMYPYVDLLKQLIAGDTESPISGREFGDPFIYQVLDNPSSLNVFLLPETCENLPDVATTSGNVVNYRDYDGKSYCFKLSDLDQILKSGINPNTGYRLTQEFMKKYTNMFKKTHTFQKTVLYPTFFEDVRKFVDKTIEDITRLRTGGLAENKHEEKSHDPMNTMNAIDEKLDLDEDGVEETPKEPEKSIYNFTGKKEEEHEEKSEKPKKGAGRKRAPNRRRKKKAESDSSESEPKKKEKFGMGTEDTNKKQYPDHSCFKCGNNSVLKSVVYDQNSGASVRGYCSSKCLENEKWTKFKKKK